MDQGINDVISYKPDESEDYYTILGCDELSSIAQITAEYKARVLSCHPDKYPGDPDRAKTFEQIQTAKDVLCDVERRHNYDKWRHAGIAMPYRKWCNMRDAVHTSMHWASPKKEFMLEGSSEVGGVSQGSHQVQMKSDVPPGDLGFIRTGKSSDETASKVAWSRETPSDMLRKFRNYEI